MMTLDYLKGLAAQGPKPGGAGIVSVCSAHPWVTEAAFRHGLEHEGPVLIEATCNLVNQFGGHTGMTPSDFRHFVEGVAGRVGFPLARLMLGGDHLGPNPWRDKPAEEAMANAKAGWTAAKRPQPAWADIHLPAQPVDLERITLFFDGPERHGFRLAKGAAPNRDQSKTA